ncbi:MAG: thioredoxin [Candidatus Limiplasma sp.]|nr:thioredoxin [Clostridiales bacterium]MDY3816411.1 thioredoxin [Candidatus Limiplasma sp.]
MSVQKITAAQFDQEVLHSDKPVLVDFYADWCGPCKMLSPVVEQIAGESDAYHVCKINVDQAADIAARYGIMSIPTLIVFKDGEAVKRTVGVQSKQAIADLLA